MPVMCLVLLMPPCRLFSGVEVKESHFYREQMVFGNIRNVMFCRLIQLVMIGELWKHKPTLISKYAQ